MDPQLLIPTATQSTGFFHDPACHTRTVPDALQNPPPPSPVLAASEEQKERESGQQTPSSW